MGNRDRGTEKRNRAKRMNKSNFLLGRCPKMGYSCLFSTGFFFPLVCQSTDSQKLWSENNTTELITFFVRQYDDCSDWLIDCCCKKKKKKRTRSNMKQIKQFLPNYVQKFFSKVFDSVCLIIFCRKIYNSKKILSLKIFHFQLLFFSSFYNQQLNCIC